jgi:hypothetical protein
MKNVLLNPSLLILFISLALTGCGQNCYETELQVRAKYERCTDLGASYSPLFKKEPLTWHWTFVCTTEGNDVYVDLIQKDGKYCRTYIIDAKN